MQKEEFDFAIFGSELDAAILAVELAQKHNARILLVRDQVNDYGLHLHQHFSMGAISGPNMLQLLLEATEAWHALFSGRDGASCYTRENLRLRVSRPEHAALLYYIENALLDAQMQFERRADRQGFEYLSLRDVIAPKRKEALEFLARKVPASQLKFCDRSDFEQINRQRNGQILFKQDNQRFTAANSILLDDDLILEQANARLKSQLVKIKLNGFVFSSNENANLANILMIDTNAAMHLLNNGDMQITSHESLSSTREEFGLAEPEQVHARATKSCLFSKDGAPLLHFDNGQKNWTIIADKIVTPFLSFSIANEVADNAQTNGFWSQRGIVNRRVGEISSIAYSNLGGDNAIT